MFFPDVHASFKFCIFVASPSPIGEAAHCAFYLHDISERDDPERCFPLTAESFARVNPNTGTAPIFRTRRDRCPDTRLWRGKHAPHRVDRWSGCGRCGAASRKFRRCTLRLCGASEDSRPTPQLVHRRAASRGPTRDLRVRRFGLRTAGEIVREAVLELTYTAHDMAPFAHDMGHVDAAGDLLPPFVWEEERRLFLRANLDAVFFHLYGVTGRDDVRYVYSTFPIVEREETAAYGSYRSRELCLAWMNALAAGDPDAEITL